MRTTLLFLFVILFLFPNSYCQNQVDDLFPYLSKNKFIFCDSNLKQRIKSKYDFVEPFNYGFSIVANNNLFGVINKNGKVLIPLKYRQITILQSSSQNSKENPNNVYFSINSDSIFYSYNGVKLSNEPIKDTYTYDDGYDYSMIIEVNKKFGLINDWRDTVIKPTYDYLKKEFEVYQFLIAKQGENFGIISVNNEIIIPFEYRNITFDHQKNMFDLLQQNDSIHCTFDLQSKNVNLFCGYSRLVKNYFFRYFLVENSKKELFYIDLINKKELIKR